MRLIDGDELKTAFPLGDIVRTECVRATIDDMPTIEPERKKGEWIYTPTEPLGYTCSVCKKGSCRFNFCPHCGADMREKGKP